MKIDRDLILKLEKLARLDLEEQERTQLLKDLNAMLGMIGKLDELNVDGVAPLRHISENENQMREDKAGAAMNPKDVFKNAPNHNGQFFKVPKIIE
ncbi:MAG: Asp-tRNA(Asn)/Glu-tRNA(Gln) amidotransferase subunit GatC [Saprospiraceae bacterium]